MKEEVEAKTSNLKSEMSGDHHYHYYHHHYHYYYYHHHYYLGKYEGHKWSLKTLWKYFDEELKIDWKPLWENIKV